MLKSLVENRAKVLVGYLFVLATALPGLSQLLVSPDNRVFYGDGDPRYALLREFEDTFRPSSNITFILTSKEPLFANPHFASSIRWISDLAEMLPGARRVDSLSTLPLLVSSDTEVVNSTIVDYVCPTKTNCRPERSDALFRKSIQRRYISDDAKTAGVVVVLDFDVRTVDAITRIDRAAEKLINDFQGKYESIEIRRTGTVPLMQAYVDATYKDLSGVLAFAILVIMSLLYLTLGSIRMMLIMLGLGTSTIAITMGIAGYAGLVIITSTATIPLIIFTIVMAASMHFFLHVIRAFSLDASTRVEQAVARAYEANWQPILLTSATTIAGLLSLGFVDSPPINEIGYWSALGLLVGTLLTLTVIPVVSQMWIRNTESRFQSWLLVSLNLHARNVERGRSSHLAFIALFLVSIAGINSLSIDDDFVRYLGEDNQFRTETEFAARELSSLNQLDVWIVAANDAGILTSTSLKQISNLDAYLRSHPYVSNVLSIADVMAEVAEHFGDAASVGTVSNEALEQMFWAYELSLRVGQSAGDLVNPDRSQSRTSVLLKDVSAASIRQLESDIVLWFNDQNVSELEIRITGEAIPISHLSVRNIPPMITGISISLFASSFLLGVFYKSAKIALVAFCATVVPVVCGIGLYGLTVQSIGLAATVIVAVTVGVVIDDAIHIIYRHEDGRKNLHLSANESAAYSIHRAGSAVVTTTLILLCGFLVLLFSDFSLNSSFGACTGIILVTALVFDLFSLPKLLVWATQDLPDTGS